MLHALELYFGAGILVTVSLFLVNIVFHNTNIFILQTRSVKIWRVFAMILGWPIVLFYIFLNTNSLKFKITMQLFFSIMAYSYERGWCNSSPFEAYGISMGAFIISSYVVWMLHNGKK